MPECGLAKKPAIEYFCPCTNATILYFFDHNQTNLWVASSAFCFPLESRRVFVRLTFARQFARQVVDVPTVATSAVACAANTVSQTWTLGLAGILVFT